jgi:diguanylate cyclase (GGDEF)-like protein
MSESPRPQILIVDDEPTNVQVVAEALSGYDLYFATNGTRALQMAVSQPFDLILLDVVMPGMDGFEALRWLKSEAKTQHIPVIFITSMTDIDDEARGFDLGAVDYIVKPVSPAITRARVRTHIEIKRQRDLLEQHAAMDGLTKIANRRRFDESLSRIWRTAQRDGDAVTLMLIDVDYFKRYNDFYGHSPGDECLRRIADALERTFSRGDDLAARYGGEEFALVIAGADGEMAVRRVLDAIAALEIPHARSDAHVFVSVSVGAVVTKADSGQPDAALAAADRLLYAAKEAGRHQGHLDDGVTGQRLIIRRHPPQPAVLSLP